MSRRNIVIVIIAISIVLAVVLFFVSKNQNPAPQGQVKAPHFLDSTPLHNEVYAAQPINITLNFDFDLGEGSKITVIDESGTDWTESDTRIEDNNTVLKKSLKQGMPAGDYTVTYTACWPDKSCHDGQLQFSIDTDKQSAYQDMRGQAEVKLDMKDIRFSAAKVVVSPDTKVTWTNSDEASHYVNTETHPEHTYFPSQNSREIKKGESYTTVFTIPGQYNYHCSAHAHQMTGSLIVARQN